MNCRFCTDSDDQIFGIIPSLGSPAEPTQPNFFGCRRCMIERGLWCPIHDLAHQDWNAGGHLCLPCHSILYAQLLPRARLYYEYLINTLPDPNVRALRNWAEDSDSLFTQIPPHNEEQLVLWSLSAMSLTRDLPFRQLLEYIAEKVDLEPLIPNGFPTSIP